MSTAMDKDQEKAGPGPEEDHTEHATRDIKLSHANRDDADEALKVFAEGQVIVLTPEDERKLLRKIDYTLMPLLFVVYGLNYLDKTTLSYASIMGLKVSMHPWT
jgi:hypothetical protein